MPSKSRPQAMRKRSDQGRRTLAAEGRRQHSQADQCIRDKKRGQQTGDHIGATPPQILRYLQQVPSPPLVLTTKLPPSHTAHIRDNLHNTTLSEPVVTPIDTAASAAIPNRATAVHRYSRWLRLKRNKKKQINPTEPCSDSMIQSFVMRVPYICEGRYLCKASERVPVRRSARRAARRSGCARSAMPRRGWSKNEWPA